HRAYLAQILSWNRSQRHRSMLGHQLRGAREFLAFLGFLADDRTGIDGLRLDEVAVPEFRSP
ncbi:MAG: hypothetical protein ABIQ16_22370, partial [Polyangiaceae bacterium]